MGGIVLKLGGGGTKRSLTSGKVSGGRGKKRKGKRNFSSGAGLPATLGGRGNWGGILAGVERGLKKQTTGGPWLGERDKEK